VLQFSPDQANGVWFSEWTENKIGKVDTTKDIPVSISSPPAAPNSYQVTRGQSININVQVSSNVGFSGKMIASGTLSRTAQLLNATGTFSEDSVDLNPGSQKVISFIFSPSKELPAGDYTLMIGTENDEISVLKAFHVTVN
jgi:virginiamycin B lyase